MKTLAVVTFAAISTLTLAAQALQVKVEQRVALFDVPPAFRNGVAMVPIRGMIDTMDGTMKWNMATSTVQCWVGGNRFDIVLNSRNARVNDRNATLEVGAFIHRGRIYAPLRFLAEASGYIVSEEDGWFVLRPLRPK